MHGYRKLLVLGLNEAIRQGRISLDAPESDTVTNECGHLFTDIAGYPSVVLWEDIGFGELRLSVWWNYDHDKHPQANLEGNARENFNMARPLAKRVHYKKFVGATVSCWLERKNSKHLQGDNGDRLIETYLRRDMSEILKELKTPKPLGFKPEGKFYM